MQLQLPASCLALMRDLFGPLFFAGGLMQSTVPPQQPTAPRPASCLALMRNLFGPLFFAGGLMQAAAPMASLFFGAESKGGQASRQASPGPGGKPSRWEGLAGFAGFAL